jgi:hypothetical protein
MHGYDLEECKMYVLLYFFQQSIHPAIRVIHTYVFQSMPDDTMRQHVNFCIVCVI